ncbi:uncharacterized protein LOC106067133 isoform X3 [Biomphalaria glabrata]|uniref:Acrosin n=1 Tax=Biomphalaria glabrata TaxID=6526 RepID=A0A9W2Z7D0_BIOGL|nr:uncharacterized protein LOC106067133 isoform X3 [Biomphalaria glabrata]
MVLASIGGRDEKSNISLTRFSSIEPRSPTSPQSPKEGDNYHIYPLPNDDDEVFADEKEVPKTYSDIAPSPPTPGTAPSTESKNWRRRQLLLHHVILIVLGVVIVLGLAVGIALAIMFVNTSASTITTVSPAEVILYNGQLTLSSPWMKSDTDLELTFLQNVNVIIQSSDLYKAFINSSFVHLSYNRTLLHFTMNFKKHVLMEIADQNVHKGTVINTADQNIDVWLAQTIQDILRNQVVKNTVVLTMPIVADSIVILVNIPVTSPHSSTPAPTESSGQCLPMTYEPCHSVLKSSHFFLPNHYNHSITQQATAAFNELSKPPFDLKCSHSSLLFLCSLLFPPCEESSLAPVQPCDTLCEVVKSGCGTFRGWPQNCVGFPKIKCIGPVSEVITTTLPVSSQKTPTTTTTVSTSATTTYPSSSLASTVTSTNFTLKIAPTILTKRSNNLKFECVPLEDFPECNDFGFFETSLPNNVFNCHTVDCLRQWFKEIAGKSIESGCTLDNSFFCGYVFPGCDKQDDNFPLFSCRESCYETVSKCKDQMVYHIDCEQFSPEEDNRTACIKAEQKPVYQECMAQTYSYCRSEGFDVTTKTSDFASNFTELIKNFDVFALPTIQSNCSTLTKFLYCGLFFPKCGQGGELVYPCRKYCEVVFSGCLKESFVLDCTDTFKDQDCLHPNTLISTTTDLPATTTTTPKPAICQAFNFSICTKIGNSQTGFPNLWGDEAISSFNKLTETAGCSKNILFYACIMLFPFCESGGSYKKPCSSLCEEVNDNCSALLFNQDCMELSEPDQGKCFSAPQPKTKKVCSATEFSCQFIDNCVNQSSLCNKKNDCGDWSDEKDCECNKDFEVKCKMGMCILSYQKCDGVYHCPDNSDELNCACPKNQYQCKNQTTCIMPEWICDGQKDCLNADDEANCSMCKEDEFTCSDSKCISLKQRCDGTFQCADVSDEMECIFPSTDEDPLQVIVERFGYFVCVSDFTEAAGQEACLKLGQRDLDTFYSKNVEPGNEENYYFQLNPNGNLSSVLGRGMLVKTCNPVYVQCINKECGHPSLNGPKYVINGKNALPGSWPWLVSIKKYVLHICGGAIIHPYFILTASHCIEEVLDFDHIYVTSGTVDLINLGQHGKVHQVRKGYMHPEYTRFKKHDVALLELKKPLIYNDYVKPLCLPEQKDVFTRRNFCYLAGWGYTSWKANFPSDYLQEIKLTLWDTEKCNSSYMWGGFLQENERCAGYFNALRGACVGDSGSPVSCKDETGTYKSVGMVTYVSKDCTDLGRPMVFTSTAPYQDWINNITDCKFSCSNGMSLFEESLLCNRIDDCGDNSDETIPCDVNFNCSFSDNFICGYKSNWKLINASAFYAINRLPLYDHTLGNNRGKFLVSFVRQEDLISRKLILTSNHCMRFHFHMRGRIKEGWTVSVRKILDTMTKIYDFEKILQPDFWQMGLIDFTPGDYEVYFRSFDVQKIAVDDILLLNSSCAEMKCLDGEFLCSTYGQKNCLPMGVRCNYIVDCDYFSDELNCSAPTFWCDFENGLLCGLMQDSLDSDITEWLMVDSSVSPLKQPNPYYNISSGLMIMIDTLNMIEKDEVKMSQVIQLLPDEFCLRLFYASTSPATFMINLTRGNDVQTLVKFTDRQTIVWTSLYATIPSSSAKERALLTYIVQGDKLGSQTITKYIMIDDISITQGRCPPFSCPGQLFECTDESYCIPPEKICDRVVDCKSYTDEKNCECTDQEFKCPNQMCIPKSKTCDLVNDCSDGSDEGSICDNKRSISCDFEDVFMCGYKTNTSTNQFSWGRAANNTGDKNGPPSDHTHLYKSQLQVSGHYVVVNNLNNGTSFTALNSFPFISNGSGFVFYYFAYNFNSFVPYVQEWELFLVVTDLNSNQQEVLWSTKPSSNNFWLAGCVMLPKGNIFISFVASKANTYTTFFALDDLELLSDSCELNLTAESRIKKNQIADDADILTPSTKDCPSTQRPCRNNMCIPSQFFCDGHSNCPDGSDELNCTTT